MVLKDKTFSILVEMLIFLSYILDVTFTYFNKKIFYLFIKICK